MIELSVKDMTCGHCVGVVRRAVESVDPQATVEVDLANKRVRVEGGKPAEDLIGALNAAGYPAAPASTQAPADSAKKGCCCSFR